MKNIEKWIIIVLSVIAAVAIGTAIYLVINKQDVVDDKEIYGIINNKAYTLDEIKKEYGNDFIKIIEEDKIVIFNGETTYGCKYNKLCEIWPDSDNGNIMWSAPLVTITFKKGDITEAEIVSSDNELDDEDKVIDLKAKELMELYISPIIQSFNGIYSNDIKTLLLINISEDIAKTADCKKLYGNKAKYEGDIDRQPGGYLVKEESEEYFDYGSICEQDSEYYDAKLLREKSFELFGEDVLVKHEIQNGWGSSFDYIEKEDGYVYLSCRCGSGPGGNQYVITSSYFENSQFKIDFDYENYEKKKYTIIFDVKNDGKYVFFDLIEQ